jgi:hypothetical protein
MVMHETDGRTDETGYPGPILGLEEKRVSIW